MNDSTKPIVACIQLNSQRDVDTNLQLVKQSVALAHSQGASLAVLPENALCMGNQFATAERFDELSQKLANIATQYNIHLLAGTLPCPYRPDGSTIADGRLRQSSLLFAPDGQCLARYDKIHLFTATVNDAHGRYDESATFEAGEHTVVATCELNHIPVTIGMMVCFDLRFPALAQRLRQAGAQILTAPSAFTYRTGEAHWRMLLQARALDSQCLVIGASQGGRHHYSKNKHRDTWGHATIVDANGVILASHDTQRAKTIANAQEDSTTTAPVVILAEFDHQAQQQYRQNMPLFQCHRLA
ncbi:nitrilase-related carbon-nitrogen hydrolase [Psychrobacter sp. I-STPA6b]|uniref:nitrilase-related carbon-nitrogen hydrolase n=1 Tax=Psychrobacter sp. I-STPA6b TaxID=2585718 RepID=UPI001D0BFC72|nr:nitrilase-related carbon-nitrogen hydrolase [Psychrobacter sp. I-STPA6b]